MDEGRLAVGRRSIDLSGRRFGRLLAIERVRCGSKQRLFWRCRCDCGNECMFTASSLIRGNNKSCGCLVLKHGHSRVRFRSVEYATWASMKRRCYNQKQRSYADYGSRGIVVCDGWRESFENFIADMGLKTSSAHEIDRRDNDGNYSCGHCDQCVANAWPANCRWATVEQQQRNSRNNNWLTCNGKTMILTDWARLLGIQPSAIHNRLNAGWTTERALTQLPKPDRRRVAG